MAERTALPLTATGVAGRLDAAREVMAERGFDAYVVNGQSNIRYLSGFTGSAGSMLVTASEALLVTDGRYRTQGAEQLANSGVSQSVELVIRTTQSEQRVALLEKIASGAKVGFSPSIVTVLDYDAMRTALPRGVEFQSSDGLIESLRAIKDAGEVERIRAACAIGDESFSSVVSQLANGLTEREFAIVLEFEMRSRGASGLSFDAIIASGENSAMPHARPTDRPIGRGELVVLDFGCVVEGYCSDMTRTVSIGEPGPGARKIFEVVAQAQLAGIEAIAEGVELQVVDRACREVIESAGFGDAFSHGTGHGVGLDIHEDPRIGSSARGTLSINHVVTVEPGVYIPGVGGVRIEDTVVVTEHGPVLLTSSPKELVL